MKLLLYNETFNRYWMIIWFKKLLSKLKRISNKLMWCKTNERIEMKRNEMKWNVYANAEWLYWWIENCILCTILILKAAKK